MRHENSKYPRHQSSFKMRRDFILQYFQKHGFTVTLDIKSYVKHQKDW